MSGRIATCSGRAAASDSRTPAWLQPSTNAFLEGAGRRKQPNRKLARPRLRASGQPRRHSMIMPDTRQQRAGIGRHVTSVQVSCPGRRHGPAVPNPAQRSSNCPSTSQITRRAAGSGTGLGPDGGQAAGEHPGAAAGFAALREQRRRRHRPTHRHHRIPDRRPGGARQRCVAGEVRRGDRRALRRRRELRGDVLGPGSHRPHPPPRLLAHQTRGRSRVSNVCPDPRLPRRLRRSGGFTDRS